MTGCSRYSVFLLGSAIWSQMDFWLGVWSRAQVGVRLAVGI